MSSYMQGVYKPQNPQKYKGNVNNIVYRSSWELRYLRKLDLDDNVISYSSEETIIPYIHPVTQTLRRYFMDFKVVYKNACGVIVTELIEIKPASQTRAPTGSKNKKKKTILNEQLTWAVNQAKWAAATKYCEKKKWNFRILTEKDLGI